MTRALSQFSVLGAGTKSLALCAVSDTIVLFVAYQEEVGVLRPSTAMTQVLTESGPCTCSPIAKVKRVVHSARAHPVDPNSHQRCGSSGTSGS
jgi:hypothetical protein